MNFYSLGQLSNNEKSDILNKHKELYNGYRKVWQTVSNEQPLYIQDFANDKEGLVVTNKGNVKPYTNFGINEQTETNEIDFKNLVKGKKYKYKTPAFEDDLEYEDEISYPVGSKHYSFKGDKGHGHLMGQGHIEDFMSDIEEGLYDVQNKFTGQFDYTEQEIDEVDATDLALAVDAEEGSDPNIANIALAMDTKEEYEVMTSAFMDEELDETYSKVDPAYNFQSDGPMQEEDMEEGFFDFSDDDEFEDLYDYDERETAFDRIRRGKGDVEDIDFEEIEDEQLRESLLKQKNKINEMFNRFKKYN
jgi:hypothetical protein